MGATTNPVAAAATILLVCTFAIVAMTCLWATSNRHPNRVRPQLLGRAAAPYWYSPTGRQDERGIGAPRDEGDPVLPAEPRHP